MSLLDGVRVLDFSIWRPGPYCTQLLAEQGAEVLKVEPPGGDPMRVFPGLFSMLNDRKRCVELDLKSEDGRAEALRLASEHDIAVEGFRPGVAARLGVGYDDLRAVNPAIVYASISGFGASGPLTKVPGHDINYQSYAGMVPPVAEGAAAHPMPPFADVAGGMAAAFAVSAAYAGALRSGVGAFIDVSMTDVLAAWVRPMGATALSDGGQMKGAAGYGTFAAKDGFVALGIVSEDNFWDTLCREVGLDDLVGVPMVERNERVEELRAALVEAIATQPRDDLVARLQSANVPASPVLSREEMLAHPHFADSEYRNGIRVVHPDA